MVPGCRCLAAPRSAHHRVANLVCTSRHPCRRGQGGALPGPVTGLASRTRGGGLACRVFARTTHPGSLSRRRLFDRNRRRPGAVTARGGQLSPLIEQLRALLRVVCARQEPQSPDRAVARTTTARAARRGAIPGARWPACRGHCEVASLLRRVNWHGERLTEIRGTRNLTAGRRPWLTLDHAANPRRLRADVQRAQALRHYCVVLRHAVGVAEVVKPGRRLVALDPDLRIREIAQQSPVKRSVTAPDAPPLGHRCKELEDVLGTYDVFDRDHDR